MKQGFSVIELVISMGIATMLMSGLFMVYNQIIGNMKRLDAIMVTDTQVLAVQQRLEKDVSGLTGVWYTQTYLQEKSDQLKGQKSAVASKSLQAPYFYSINDDHQFKLATWITGSPLQLYGTGTDAFTRVVYKLQPDIARPNRFVLLRKEVKNPTELLDESFEKEGKFYILATDIIAMQITYYFFDRTQFEKSFEEKAVPGAKPATEQSTHLMRTTKEWKLTPEQHDTTKSADKTTPEDDIGQVQYPYFMEVVITFGQGIEQDEKKYTFGYALSLCADGAPASIIDAKYQK
jgi:hypothetical protein